MELYNTEACILILNFPFPFLACIYMPRKHNMLCGGRMGNSSIGIGHKREIEDGGTYPFVVHTFLWKSRKS